MKLVGKAILVAFVAAIMAWLPIGCILSMDINNAVRSFPLALLGAFVVGLPIAFLVYGTTARKPSTGFLKLLLIANAFGGVLALLTLLVAGPFGAIFFGLPTLIAANGFAIAGWFLIIRPERGPVRG